MENVQNQKGMPQNYMFGQMRAALGITKEQDILDHVYSLPEAEQEGAHLKIQNIERQAMAEQVPQAGLVTLMEYLDSKNLKKGICTRNFECVDELSFFSYLSLSLSLSLHVVRQL